MTRRDRGDSYDIVATATMNEMSTDSITQSFADSIVQQLHLAGARLCGRRPVAASRRRRNRSGFALYCNGELHHDGSYTRWEGAKRFGPGDTIGLLLSSTRAR